MNQKQKDKITEMRKNGGSYLEIASSLGISQNTVKSFCQRNRLNSNFSPQIEYESLPLCRQCSAPVKQLPGKKAKIFCSDECRMSWWNAHPGIVKRKNGRTFSCQTCGRDFIGYGSRDRKFCSHTCYGLSKVVR